jgi:hypothetical protein
MSTKAVVTKFAVAACASLTGFFAVEVPAQATPRTPLPLAPTNCDWTMQSTEMDINQDNGLVIHLSYDNTDTKGYASYTAKDGGPWRGPLTGGIVKGTNQWNFTADFGQTITPGDGGAPTHEGFTNRYTGKINPDGSGASGTTTNSAGVTNAWNTSAQFLCIGRAPADSPPPLDPKGQVEAPAAQAPPPAEKPPTDQVRMLITPALPNIKVHVSSTAAIPGRCTYHAQEVNGLAGPIDEPFDIAKMGTKDLTFLAPTPLQRWQVVLSCRGDFNGQDVEFGHQEQSVAGFGG